MKKLKLNLEDLSVVSFAPAGAPRDRGTMRGHLLDEMDEMAVIETGGGDSYDVACDAEYYATRSINTCPCNFSCLRNCSFRGPCSETV